MESEHLKVQNIYCQSMIKCSEVWFLKISIVSLILKGLNLKNHNIDFCHTSSFSNYAPKYSKIKENLNCSSLFNLSPFIWLMKCTYAFTKRAHAVAVPQDARVVQCEGGT